MDIFSHIFVVKICGVCLKRPKINEKEAGVCSFKKILTLTDARVSVKAGNGLEDGKGRYRFTMVGRFHRAVTTLLTPCRKI